VLSPYRVIDMTDEKGILCGQILADLGADVVQVEPPGGSSARRVGPWYGDDPHPDHSLFFWAYARGKRSIALDPELEEDRETLRRLIDGADFFIESEAPGRLSELGLSHETLVQSNPSLIHVSITPFGQTGPKAGYRGTDLTQVAAGGHAYLSGDAEYPPLRVQVPQAHAHAAADAAVGALIAHFARRRSGRGQHVDVSHQQSVTLATQFRILDTPLDEAPAQRLSGGVLVRGHFVPLRYRLADGWVVLGPAFLPSTGHFMGRLLEWVHEEGGCAADLVDRDWGQFALRLLGGADPADDLVPLDEALTAFFRGKSKQEVMDTCVSRRLLLAPVLGLDEIVEGEQLRARNFLVPVAHSEPELEVRYPGPVARFGATPIQYRSAPPRIDEHGAALRGESARRPVGFETRDAPGGPLADVKVLDLFWILAGPGSTRMLADYGATVVHVESMRHLDTLRVIPPYQFSNPHPEGSGAYQCANANKLGMTLNLREPIGQDVLMELVEWADVVTESFAPGVMEAAGLGWDRLSAVNPDLIMISSCLMGQHGPWRDFTGFGNLAASVTGFQSLAAWPDAAPDGPYGAYTDFIGVRYNALAILAALEHRARTGEGQYIDMAQAESALHFIAPAFLDYTVNGRVPAPIGNEDAEHAPHAFYPSAGEDRWIAIAIRNDDEWRTLCNLIGQDALASHRDDTKAVDEAISGWTSARSPAAAQAELQARGIAAHEALDTPGLYDCPQLQHRQHFVEIAHDIYQTTTIESTRLRLSTDPARVPERALSFGRDNRYVLEEILGYSPERIAELAAQGVLI
jgi:crotonobetainyl-CoA:carnitine CoA-transferase CaiB-like acyl-CoA transferase